MGLYERINIKPGMGETMLYIHQTPFLFPLYELDTTFSTSLVVSLGLCDWAVVWAISRPGYLTWLPWGHMF